MIPAFSKVAHTSVYSPEGTRTLVFDRVPDAAPGMYLQAEEDLAPLLITGVGDYSIITEWVGGVGSEDVIVEANTTVIFFIESSTHSGVCSSDSQLRSLVGLAGGAGFQIDLSSGGLSLTYKPTRFSTNLGGFPLSVDAASPSIFDDTHSHTESLERLDGFLSVFYVFGSTKLSAHEAAIISLQNEVEQLVNPPGYTVTRKTFLGVPVRIFDTETSPSFPPWFQIPLTGLVPAKAKSISGTVRIEGRFPKQTPVSVWLSPESVVNVNGAIANPRAVCIFSAQPGEDEDGNAEYAGGAAQFSCMVEGSWDTEAKQWSSGQRVYMKVLLGKDGSGGDADTSMLLRLFHFTITVDSYQY